MTFIMRTLNKHKKDNSVYLTGLRGNRRRKMAVFVVVFIISIAFFRPAPAYAIFGLGDISVTVGDIPRQIAKIYDRITALSKEGLKELAIVSLNNAIDTYVQNVAYETAVYLATGDVGQKPLVVKKPLGKILEDAGNVVVGDFLDRLGKDILGH